MDEEKILAEFIDRFGLTIRFFDDHLLLIKKRKPTEIEYSSCKKISIVRDNASLNHIFIECARGQSAGKYEFYYAKEDYEKIKKVVDFANSKTEDRHRIHEVERRQEMFESTKTHIVTTCPFIEDYKIVEYHGIVTGCTALGTGIFTDFSAGFADLAGNESRAMIDKMERAKDTALNRAIMESAKRGGNAIVGLSIDYTALINNMILIGATGTSVTIEKTG